MQHTPMPILLFLLKLLQPTYYPNILLIIGDDIGIDATSNMYPGLIEDLTKRYGPSGHNHPKYREIAGRPASTPVLDTLARGGMRFTQAWAQPFCSGCCFWTT